MYKNLLASVRIVKIKPLRTGIRAISLTGEPSIIKYLKIEVIYNQYDAMIVFENDYNIDLRGFRELNRRIIINYPELYQEMFKLPDVIDRDIVEFILKNNFLSYLFLEYPARIYHHH